MIDTQFQTKVSTVRTDNGTEFLQSACLNLFGAKGILHQRSIVKTPQQNGVVERKHRHFLDTARAIRFQAGFSKQFWGECVLAVTHIINKLPMANLSWKSPFEVLYGSPHNLDYLRAIGCLCYATNVGVLDKFEPRAQKCVLLGYTFGFKGYELYDLQTKKVFHSRDVIFQEEVFPFKDLVQSAASDSPSSSFLWPNSEMSSDFPSTPPSKYISPLISDDSASHILPSADNMVTHDSL